MNLEQKSLERAQSFADFCNEHKRFPSVKTNDPYEHKLAVWIVQIRRTKRGTTSDPSKSMVLYPSVETFLNEHVQKWLDGAGQRIGNRIDHCERKAQRVIEFIQTRKRFPVATLGTPNDERVLAHFLNRLRMANKGSSKFANVLHDSVKKMLNDAVPFWTNPKYFSK